MLIIFTAAAGLAGCQSTPPAAPASPAVPPSSPTIAPAVPTAAQAAAKQSKNYSDLKVCFVQWNEKSDWRAASTASLQEAAQAVGASLQLIEQEDQVSALRTCISSKVDVIGLVPGVETGWETVFQEAKTAGIPLIVVDRPVSLSQDLYTAFFGSDFVEEGRKAGQQMLKLLPQGGGVVEITGPENSTASLERAKGFREALQGSKIVLLDSQSGDFSRTKGKEIMVGFLKKYEKKIQALYSHSDEMAVGAIQAIEEAGNKPGTEIQIISNDASRAAFEAMVAGKMNAAVEYNPLFGPQFLDLALKAASGEKLEARISVEETIYTPGKAAKLLPTRKY